MIYYNQQNRMKLRPRQVKLFGLFLCSKGGGQVAKKAEASVFLPRMSRVDRRTILRGASEANKQTVRTLRS